MGRVAQPTTSSPRCPACSGAVPPSHGGRGRQPTFCGSDRCRQARQRRAAERREAVALLRLVADMAGYASGQIGNCLSPSDARAAVAEVAGELAEAAARLRRMARPGPAERRMVVQLMFARGLSGAQIAARAGVSEKTAYRYRARSTGPRRSQDAI
jgi:DNA-directed RNA polymerase specialized sigma24 family protein